MKQLTQTPLTRQELQKIWEVFEKQGRLILDDPIAVTPESISGRCIQDVPVQHAAWAPKGKAVYFQKPLLICQDPHSRFGWSLGSQREYDETESEVIRA